MLYSWLCMQFGNNRSPDPAVVLSESGAVAVFPASVSASLFGATFQAYHGEWIVGVSIGLVLQIYTVQVASLIPAVVAHIVMELILDAYRRRRPIPKPRTGDANGAGLHLT